MRAVSDEMVLTLSAGGTAGTESGFGTFRRMTMSASMAAMEGQSRHGPSSVRRRFVTPNRPSAAPHPTVKLGSVSAVSSAMSMRLASIAILVLLLDLPARAQSFSRQDLDCAVAATIEEARADKGTTGKNGFHELLIFFIRRLNAQDDQTNWARIAYDRSKLNPKEYSAELVAKCTELYQSSLHR
jgi:hypothetical protein